MAKHSSHFPFSSFSSAAFCIHARLKNMNLSHTVRSGLTLKQIKGFNVTTNRYVNIWRHVSPDGYQVGPSYPTKAEALADTYDYAKRAGWLPE